MRRDEPELPFTGRTPRQAKVPDDYRNLTFHSGRFFRNESTISIPKDRLTQDERAVMDAHRVAEAEAAQAHADANLALALRVGEALKVLKGDG